MRIWVVLLTLLVCIVYAQGISGEFVWDDRVYFLDNDIIPNLNPWQLGKILLEPSNYWGDHVPVTTLLFVTEHFIFGNNTTGYHLVSLALYLAIGLLVYRFVKELYSHLSIADEKSVLSSISGRDFSSMLVITLFMLHPAHVEVVSYISGQRDLLFALFSLGSLLWILRAHAENRPDRKRAVYLIITVGLYYLSMLSKLSTVATGMFIPLMWLTLLRKRGEGVSKPFAFWIAVNVPVLGWLLYSMKLLSPYGVVTASVPIFERLFRAVRILGAQMKLALVPYPLNFGYPFERGAMNVDLNFVLGAVLLLAAVYALIKFSRSLITFGILLFVVYHIYVLQLYKELINATIYDRYLFIPLLGVFIVLERTVAYLRYKSTSYFKVACAAALGLALIYAGLTFNYVPKFRSDVASLEHAYRTFPQWRRASFEYTYSLIEADLLEDASYMTENEISFDNPRWVRPFFRGWILLKQGRRAEALKQLRIASYYTWQLGHYPFADLQMATIYAEQGLKAKARQTLQGIINHPLHNPIIYYQAKVLLKELESGVQ